MTVTNEGLRIELTESAAGTFFDSGSARMSNNGGELLKTLAQELGKLPNRMAIEGHSDSKPYPPSATYTNWELSADRANAARRFMEQNGLSEAQITQIRGFADLRVTQTKLAHGPLQPTHFSIIQYVDKADAETSVAPEEGVAGSDKSGGEKK